ncbi:putative ribosome biogenesis GTPase RsgA [Insulibacter thermoxylanivorax]|uniref:Small ribosomal subunit biogenesis GTPase RsgA n=1 Tax=Insulibacter thermoxylanivorax TaxID=2749268 RepID=A0A916VFE4_9BACL|nr:ribosome small subunit-dependent GTPase A [Insulibacter thermoxylanivorax]GFR37793.1 putative ribosome biogenesis GTPase RsgA [Insulibacter thermoxylanivorax]
MARGLIVKALSGFYYVMPDDGGETVQCRARGVFKVRGITPLVGDRVHFEVEATGEGTVTEIEPRTSELVRPPIANVDTAVLVFSIAEPAVSHLLLDRFLVHVELAGLTPIICFSKKDLGKDPQELEAAMRKYTNIGYEVFATSSVHGDGTDELVQRLTGHISVFAGQSGVGKSTLLNAMIPGLDLETREISRRLGRGKHTTRHVELIPLPQSGWIADTPGFSQLDFTIEPEELTLGFRELREAAESCKFRGCLHISEPGCAVTEGLQEGCIDPTRYEHYKVFLEEVKEAKEKRRRNPR